MAVIKKDTNIHPYRALADAVVMQACDDYRNGYRDISLGNAKKAKKNADEQDWDTERIISEAISFIRSGRLGVFTTIDADYLEKNLKKDIVTKLGEDYREAWKDIRKGKEVLKAERKRKSLIKFIRSGRFQEISDDDPDVMVEKINHLAVKDVLTDFEKAMNKVAKGKDVLNAEADIEEIKDFMRSSRFRELTDLDAEALIARMEK